MGVVRGFVAAMEAWEEESNRLFDEEDDGEVASEDWRRDQKDAGRRIFERFTTSSLDERGNHFQQPSEYSGLVFGKCSISDDTARVEAEQPGGVFGHRFCFVLTLCDTGWRVCQRVVRSRDGSTTVVF